MPVIVLVSSVQYTRRFVLRVCPWTGSCKSFLTVITPAGLGLIVEKERRQRMSVKASSRSRIKTIKVICDRCKQIVEGIRGEEFTGGFYDMTRWEEYRHENEQYVCDSCMFADPKYVERYGSCF